MANDADKNAQKEIEELLRQAQEAARGGTGPGSAGTRATGGGGAGSPATAVKIQSSTAGPGGEGVGGELGGSVSALDSGMTGASRSAGGAALEDVQILLAQAEQALQSIDQPQESSATGAQPFSLRELAGAPASTERATLDLLSDIELDLKIELGRTQMYVEDVLKLRRGSVVALNKLAGDPVDIYVNGRMIARGEVLVLNDNFCVRVAELVAGDDVE